MWSQSGFGIGARRGTRIGLVCHWKCLIITWEFRPRGWCYVPDNRVIVTQRHFRCKRFTQMSPMVMSPYFMINISKVLTSNQLADFVRSEQNLEQTAFMESIRKFLCLSLLSVIAIAAYTEEDPGQPYWEYLKQRDHNFLDPNLHRNRSDSAG
jgi:hypothetical protein